MTTKPFAKLDIHLHSNEKILPLSHAGFRLYVCSLTFCKAERTNGHIGLEQARQLARSQRVPSAAIKELLDRGRYEQNGNGFIVHDFDEWQQLDTEISEKRSEAGRVGGYRSGEVRRSKSEASASGLVQANTKQTMKQTEAKRSVESESERETDLEAPIGALSPIVPSRPRITPARLILLAYAMARKEQFPSTTLWTPTEKREDRARRWLKTFPLNDLIDAAVGWRRDPFSLGENDQHTRYCDFELIFRDEAHIEKFRDLERDAHAAETVFVDAEPEWQKKRREILERELDKQEGG